MKAMYPIVLITALIFIPVIIGAICAVAGFRAYRARHQLQHDVERAHNLDDIPPTNENNTTHCRWPSSHNSWPLSRNQPDIVPSNIAPTIKPLTPPKTEIKGIGGGFVEHWAPSNSKLPMMPDSDTRYEHARRYVSKKEKENENFENTGLYAGPGWNPDNEREVSVEPDIPAPQPMYTSAIYGRYGSAASPTMRIYGEDARAADVWAKIERQESFVENGMTQAVEVQEEEFADVDLEGDLKFVPVFAVGSGSTEGEHVDEGGEWTGYTPVHTPKTRHSFGSERSLTHRGSFPAAKQLVCKSSWSTASRHDSRSSMESTRENVDETAHPTQLVRRSFSTTSKKASVVNPFANRASSELRRPELVEYSDSDEEASRQQ
jgi:hypothetical protein